jgi:VCBS repeat-containing protein
LVQTGQTNGFCGNAIDAVFERTNIFLEDQNGPVPYSSKVYLHRLYPEVSGTGVINATVGGANSTAQTPTYGQTGTMSINTDTPWVTTQQNHPRTSSVKIETNDATDTWNVTALNWQATVAEDSF